MRRAREDCAILADIEQAEERFCCSIERVSAMLMIAAVVRDYRSGVDFEDLLERAVAALHQHVSDGEMHAYKYVLGKAFGRRRHEVRSRSKDRV